MRNNGWPATVTEGPHEAVAVMMTTASTEAWVTVTEELGEFLGVRSIGTRVPKTERRHAAGKDGTVVVAVVMTMRAVMSTSAESAESTSPTTHAVPPKVRREGEGHAVEVEWEGARRRRSPVSVAVPVVPRGWRREGHFALCGR